MAVSKACEECGKLFEATRSTARFCSERCKKRAQRKKQPIPPAAEPSPALPATFEDVAAALNQARALSNTFARLSATAPRQLRSGCERIGQAITRAINDEEW